ncbi:ABC transporter permease [Paenibacillus sp. UMB4589-SE434]|uniref:ABC transporter permease n=1 Tax=Paenibacillus sp. UMB4589-SE434 TaxID=3046314 RepID=UPI00254F4128|nr:ABC transporter permease [Paenibacillus sp. UMB4589-SE434]MDK8182844.1 ABC transporter permease [Paenibacillus sp. UMB4589-SE434]
MVDLVYTELLKLKRAKMFLVSVIGASAAPIMMYLAYLNMKSKTPDEPISFELSFYNTNLNVLLLIGPLLYGVITAYLFNREYAEDTLKNLLTIPVSRTNLIISKLILLLGWILVLTLEAWGLTLLLGIIGGFEGLSAAILIQSLKEYLIGAVLLFLLSTPTMLTTFLYKNYVPTIIFTAVITLGNVSVINSDFKPLYPWSAVHVITINGYLPQYPPLYSFLAIGITSIVGLIATIVYFKKVDIQ